VKAKLAKQSLQICHFAFVQFVKLDYPSVPRSCGIPVPLLHSIQEAQCLILELNRSAGRILRNCIGLQDRKGCH
jgi:hypothetical protein